MDKINVYDAVLLIGPTGSGKTPLGNYLDKTGLSGQGCRHFDFGENLRAAVDRSFSEGFLDYSERAVIKRVLEEGALLEDSDFAIAEKILVNFLNVRGMQEGDILVLNGLPRHEGQADSLKKMVHVRFVVNLVCKPETVLERIENNSGGDRGGRVDDSFDEVQRKLILFAERTQPLLTYYKGQGADVVDFEVGPETESCDIAVLLNKKTQ